MAAYCFYFITEDDKTYLKAKAVYEKEKVSTIVCKVNEFLLETEEYDFEIKNVNGFLDLIYCHCEVKDVEHNFCSIESRKEFMAGPLKKKLLNYFNTIMIINSKEKFELATFKKSIENYSDFIYFSEIKLLVDKITRVLGKDLLNKGYYNEDENKEINEGKWKGRTWDISGFYLILDISNGEVLPTFTIMKL
ncbi:MAG: hypothetical protein Q8L81_10920 [Bacteroidota bacterium]|nr:hypothetical protein [Bacteroidota bacterium]